MSGRPIPTLRLILVSSVAIIFIIFFVFFVPTGPESPATRAPGHLDKASSSDANLGKSRVTDDILKGDVVMPKLGNETAK